MMTSRAVTQALCLILAVVAFPGSLRSAFAQVAVVIRSVNLRADPSTTNPPLRLLFPPERLELIPPKEEGAYYRVRTEAGETGWVWQRNVNLYRREEWMARWADADRDCQDTRHEVLAEESAAPVTLSANGCRVDAGQWVDPYSGEVFTNPSDLDIDHVVPLANAHISGGWVWDRARREAYANDLNHAEHLLAVKNSLNRQKGDKSPDKWKPPRQEYWCEYATIWLDIKRRWQLILTAEEAAAIAEMKATCP
ncbi:MAG: DUF1524 domain-containing protein [Candidatus Binatia bacterium]